MFQFVHVFLGLANLLFNRVLILLNISKQIIQVIYETNKCVCLVCDAVRMHLNLTTHPLPTPLPDGSDIRLLNIRI